jgi:hypothetical protein
MVARLSREPLVHFLLLGLLLFLLYAVLGGSGGDRSIRVDDKVVAGLTAQFERTWQRPPNAAELNGLIESYVREEIFYQEGIALGLDRDDQMIKRRVRQKFETIAEESEAATPPTGAELNAWLRDHADRYADPALITFEQVMVEPSRHVGSIEAALQSARMALAEGAEPAEVSASRMLPSRFDLFPLDLVERDLGADFAKRLPSLRSGQWEGPVRSGYGIHLVRIEKLIPGRVPPLDNVRQAVARDFEAARRIKAADGYFRRIRDDYRIELTAALPATQAK